MLPAIGQGNLSPAGAVASTSNPDPENQLPSGIEHLSNRTESIQSNEQSKLSAVANVQVEGKLTQETFTLFVRTLIIEFTAYKYMAEKYIPLLLAPAEVGQCHASSPMIVGDSDGSVARIIAAGIVAGKIEITQQGVMLLAEVLNYEVAAIKSGWLTDYQGNIDVQQKLEALTQHLSYHQSDRPLIFLGDIVHDRFSNNKDITREVTENLRNVGAEFVIGNHDSARFYMAGALSDCDGGTYAKNSWAKAENPAEYDRWKEHENKVYKAVYFDKNSNTLCIHNGIAEYHDQETGEAGLITAFGPLKMPKDSDSLIAAIEKQYEDYKTSEARPSSETECRITEKKYINKQTGAKFQAGMTDFRPSDDEISRVAARFEITIIHGHNGYTFKPKVSKLTHAPVINLNSRSIGYGVSNENSLRATGMLPAAVFMGR